MEPVLKERGCWSWRTHRKMELLPLHLGINNMDEQFVPQVLPTGLALQAALYR